ncbi:Glycosyltransferase involved in cell wall bisynthesis [Chitinophaga terrae (ex Kim and Jung 2007)]|uniref:Glycosyltransferase involved in cell wall bisynthesis n=1 Tax=Chitinophaga terrae (ex Kim and Jung 2007) TaxID=408074 RepID=A0A1H4CC45_9BACT|nr:glycosyltransferase family 4 protein [Chitinophaga terrae (ex Kim and Jung 2007)]GEP88882.1 glycosyl transferase [Chitinophaga terrae (ex Kim and Jung 2007)]SEA57934.1 Glycosyltransferase involved in cell wall bisynthesis [Chitinophaga terrae (ex Kim and Jung 2007)]
MSAQRKIRVLETIRQGKIGGGESHVLDLVASLDKSNFEAVVLSFTDGPMIAALQAMNIPAHVIESEKAFDISVWLKVRQFIKEQQIDIVHVHGTRANTNVLWAARSLKLPVIYTIHGWSFHEGLKPLMKKARIAAEKFITRRAQVNICVSDANRMTGKEAFGQFKAIVIKNGVNLEKFDHQGEYPDLRVAYQIPAHHLVAGYIARMTLQKDPVTMIRGFAEVLKVFPDITLLVIGEGELKKVALETARELGIEENIRFDNFRKDIPAVLQAVDIYCLPSLWEGFPIGVLEAMAMGKAVVASDVDGTREAVQHEVNGLLIPASDPAALAEAIVRLCKDAIFRKRLQVGAINTVQRQYTITQMTRQIEAVYHQLYKQ